MCSSDLGKAPSLHPAAADDDCCSHHSDHESAPPGSEETGENGDGHFCVGSHVFYVASPRVDAPDDAAVAFGLAPQWVDAIREPVSLDGSMGRSNPLNVAPRLPLRAALHVYLF